MRRFWPAVALVTVAAALAAAGCGGSDDSSSGETTAARPTRPLLRARRPER